MKADHEEQKLRLLQVHREFLEFPQTQLVLSRLDSFRIRLLEQAENLALESSTEEKAIKKLVESNNIKRILGHIRDPEKFVSLNNNNT